MPRPRRGPDTHWYLPCPRCGLEYKPVARWPDGAICGYCYQQAKRTRGTCVSCGHDGVLPGRTAEGNTCRTCSGIGLNLDCTACGAEDELYSGGRCWSCTLTVDVEQVLADTDGAIRAELRPLADALKGMPRANSGLTWIRQEHVQKLLRQLAVGELGLDHDVFDRLPRSKTVTYVRDLLVEHGVLPPRDRNLATFELWLLEKLKTVEDDEHRKIVERFGRWHHLRRLRKAAGTAPVTLSALMNAKQTTTVAINFLTWLAGQSIDLNDVSQAEIDRWHAIGASTNARVDTFLFWARSHRLTTGKLDVPRHHRGNGPILGQDARIDAIRHVLLDDDMPLPTRVAAGLVLLYGQPVHRVSATRIGQVAITDNGVTIRFGRDDLDVPEPFATLITVLYGSRANLQTAAHHDCPWLFPGYAPGQHINANHLSGELRQHGAPPLASRAGAWQQLVREIAPSVLADALGISPATAMSTPSSRRRIPSLRRWTSGRVESPRGSRVINDPATPGSGRRAWSCSCHTIRAAAAAIADAATSGVL